jgi:FixJ family two-component response regulator
MNNLSAEPIVYVVDDDAAVRDSLEIFLRAAGFKTKTYADPLAFFAEQEQAQAGCLILDLHLPTLSGLHLQEQLSAAGSPLPIIFITGHGDIPTAVQAMKVGAFEFIEKPFSQTLLLESIQRAFALNLHKRQVLERRQNIDERLATLTPRENEVLQRIIDGKASKLIAAELTLSQRTVEIYRSNIMQKMRAKSVAHLVRLFSGGGLDTP